MQEATELLKTSANQRESRSLPFAMDTWGEDRQRNHIREDANKHVSHGEEKGIKDSRPKTATRTNMHTKKARHDSVLNRKKQSQRKHKPHRSPLSLFLLKLVLWNYWLF